MYSRFSSTGRRTVPPAQYSGYAFREQTEPPSPPSPPPPPTVAAPPQEEVECLSPLLSADGQDDRLLLLGLILLLSHREADRELLLWLALLLLYR